MDIKLANKLAKELFISQLDLSDFKSGLSDFDRCDSYEFHQVMNIKVVYRGSEVFCYFNSYSNPKLLLSNRKVIQAASWSSHRLPLRSFHNFKIYLVGHGFAGSVVKWLQYLVRKSYPTTVYSFDSLPSFKKDDFEMANCFHFYSKDVPWYSWFEERGHKVKVINGDGTLIDFVGKLNNGKVLSIPTS